jgi:hypothetical protein|nr:MAG TPA: hypothetical protein [Caudoviricetes sp.]
MKPIVVIRHGAFKHQIFDCPTNRKVLKLMGIEKYPQTIQLHSEEEVKEWEAKWAAANNRFRNHRPSPPGEQLSMDGFDPVEADMDNLLGD